jgi:hypothetical protein
LELFYPKDSDDPQGPYTPLSIHRAQTASSHHAPPHLHLTSSVIIVWCQVPRNGYTGQITLLAWFAELNGDAANIGVFAASVAGRAVLVTLLVDADILAVLLRTEVALC